MLACGRLVNSSGSYQVHTHTAKNTEGVSLYWVEGVNEEEKALLQVFLHQRHSVQIYCVLFLFIFFIIILFLLKNIPEFHTQISFLSLFFFTTSESNGSLLHIKVKVLILRHCNTICVTESAKSVKVFLEASWLHLCVVILKLNESSEIDVITDDDPKQNLMFGVKKNNFSGGF